MGLGPRGGFRHDNTDERNNTDDQTPALNRGKYEPAFVKNSSAYVAGQSRQQEEQQAYARDAGHTRPQLSRREQADMARLQEEARNISAQGRPQVQQQQPEQTPQAQPRKTGDRRDTAERQQRQFDLSAKLRGKLDAMEAKGLVKLGERRDFGSERMFNIAAESYHQTKQDIAKGKFGAMADRAEAAADNNQQQGQSQQTEVSNTPAAPSSGSRFGSMADRASAAAQPKQTGATTTDGLEQR